MDLTSAVKWWEESQLSVLVLGSLVVQWFLFVSASLRKLAIPSWFRFSIWIAYLGSDALAIYGLATLFNRHRNQDRNSGHSNLLEVAWAPVLLIHLGGQDGITAYNIEDNELWRRHVVTAVSQVTVAVYVFCISWPGTGDKRLLQAAILLFVVGILKCLEKPWALKSASINSLVNHSEPAHRTANKEGEINSLQDFVREARDFVQNAEHPHQAQKEDVKNSQQDDVQGAMSFGRDYDHPQAEVEGDAGHSKSSETLEDLEPPYKLFVDLASPLPQRLSILKCFWVLKEKRVYRSLQVGISRAYDFLYTKLEMLPVTLYNPRETSPHWTRTCTMMIRNCRMVLPWAAIGLFHNSHRETYNHNNDVFITYVLFCCTAILESYNTHVALIAAVLAWPDTVSQYSLIGFLARNKKHATGMRIVSFFGCKDYLDQHWCMKPCSSSHRIVKLVLQHVKDGWKKYIQDASTYKMFSDHRGQWTLELKECSHLGWSLLNRPFDESVLLWHIATDFCFYSSAFSRHRCAFDKVPQTWRWGLLLRPFLPFWQWCKRGIQIFSGGLFPFLLRFCQWYGQQVQRFSDRLSTFMLRFWQQYIPGEIQRFYDRLFQNHWTRPRCGELTCCKAVQWQWCIPEEIQRFYDRLFRSHRTRPQCGELTCCKAVQCTQMSNYMMYLLFVNPEMLMPGTRRNLFTTAYGELKGILKDNNPPLEETVLTQRIIVELKSTEGSQADFIHDAWELAKALLALGDEKKMWEVIEGVWVEMLCFSAGRCRGYLHAKALGTGGELLTYIWLLLSNMGMETLAERMQRMELPRGRGSNSAGPSASDVRTNAAPSTSEVPTGAAPSTSEIRIATGEDMV